MTSNILPYTRELPILSPDTIPNVTRNTLKIIEIFNACLGNPGLINIQELVNPQALQKARIYYRIREGMLAASDEEDYTIGSERDQYLIFLNHHGREINAHAQGVLNNTHLIAYLREHQTKPII